MVKEDAPAKAGVTGDVRLDDGPEHIGSILGRVLAQALVVALKDPDVGEVVRALGEGEKAEPKATDLSTEQVCKRLGISRSKLRRSGISPTRYIGSSPRFDLDHVRGQFEARGRKAAAPRAPAPDEDPIDISAVARRAGLRVAK